MSLPNTHLPSFYSTPPSDQTTVYLFMYLCIIYLSSITKPQSVCISTNSPRYNGQHKRNTKRLFSERKKGDKRKRISCERVSNVVAPSSKKLLRDYGLLVVYRRSSMKPPPLKWGPLSDTCSPPRPFRGRNLSSLSLSFEPPASYSSQRNQ